MKKMRGAVVLLAMFVGSALGTGPAFAQELYPPEPTVIVTVPETAPAALPVTGASITWFMVLVAALILVGGAALWAGRRRSRETAA